jgi:hypothetical protein
MRSVNRRKKGPRINRNLEEFTDRSTGEIIGFLSINLLFFLLTYEPSSLHSRHTVVSETEVNLCSETIFLNF